MKVKYKYIKSDKEIQFKWNSSKKIISINKDEDLDLNDLYDYIINNINNFDLNKTFEDETDEANCDDSLEYKAFCEIIKAIKKETKEIQKKYKEINL